MIERKMFSERGKLKIGKVRRTEWERPPVVGKEKRWVTWLVRTMTVSVVQPIFLGITPSGNCLGVENDSMLVALC